MANKKEKIDFLATMRNNMSNGFWFEEYKKGVMKLIEKGYKEDVTDEWGISDIVVNGDKVLLKWYKKILKNK